MSYDKALLEELRAKARTLRRDVVISIGVGVAGHLGGSCSSADIVAAHRIGQYRACQNILGRFRAGAAHHGVDLIITAPQNNGGMMPVFL